MVRPHHHHQHNTDVKMATGKCLVPVRHNAIVPLNIPFNSSYPGISIESNSYIMINIHQTKHFKRLDDFGAGEKQSNIFGFFGVDYC